MQYQIKQKMSNSPKEIDFFDDPAWPLEKFFQLIMTDDFKKQSTKLNNSSKIQQNIGQNSFQSKKFSNQIDNEITQNPFFLNDQQDLFDTKKQLNMELFSNYNLKPCINFHPYSCDQEELSSPLNMQSLRSTSICVKNDISKQLKYPSNLGFKMQEQICERSQLKGIQNCAKIQGKQNSSELKSLKLSQLKQQHTNCQQIQSKERLLNQFFKRNDKLEEQTQNKQEPYFSFTQSKHQNIFDLKRNVKKKISKCKASDKKKKQNFIKSNVIKAKQNQNQNKKQKDKICKYKIFKKQEKQYIVHLAKIMGSKYVSQTFNISVNNLSRWKKNCQRKIGGGRKVKDQQLQQKMILYVRQMKKLNAKITRKMIQAKAKQISNNQNFKASKGWFQRFIVRNQHEFIISEQQNQQIITNSILKQNI